MLHSMIVLLGALAIISHTWGFAGFKRTLHPFIGGDKSKTACFNSASDKLERLTVQPISRISGEVRPLIYLYLLSWQLIVMCSRFHVILSLDFPTWEQVADQPSIVAECIESRNYCYKKHSRECRYSIHD